MKNRLLTRLILIAFIGTLLFPTTGLAERVSNEETDTLHITRWYKVYWLGMHVANLVTEVKEDDDGIFHMESHINSKGIAKKVSKFWNVTKSSTRKTAKGEFIPYQFDSISRLRKKKRSIAINYVDSGTIEQETVTPPDNRHKRPAVENERKIGTFDPHTAVLVAHKQIKDALDSCKKYFTVPIYDARRLSNLNFVMKGRKKLKYNDKVISVVHVTLERDAVAGYTNNEKKRMKKENPVIDLYLEDNHLMLPVKVVANAPIGSATAILERQCYDISSCETTPKSYAYVGSIPW